MQQELQQLERSLHSVLTGAIAAVASSYRESISRRGQMVVDTFGLLRGRGLLRVEPLALAEPPRLPRMVVLRCPFPGLTTANQTPFWV